jgi:hypothetical protein
LHDALDGQAGQVEFVDISEVGRNPARLIPVWQWFLDTRSSPRRPVRGIGEPIWPGRRPEEILEIQLHEALLNIAVDPEIPFWLVCPYDAGALSPVAQYPVCRLAPNRDVEPQETIATLTQRRQFSKIAFTNARRRPTSAAPRPYLLATTTTGGESLIVLVLAPQWTTKEGPGIWVRAVRWAERTAGVWSTTAVSRPVLAPRPALRRSPPQHDQAG